ncbi:MAG: nucleoside hydrolase [Candidatus Limnocylindrales bacterium]
MSRADPTGSAPQKAGPRPIILDCDPGHDDALAMLLALARPEVRVLGVTTVGGNADLQRTTRNALAVLTLAGRTDVPVAIGAAGPLEGSLHVAPGVHGESGLDGADLPEPAAQPVPDGAVALMARLISGSPAPVTLVPTGPLTNIALLLRAHPELRPRIAAISLMGGAIGEGNATASAEFNIWVDPEAAAEVFESGLPLAMMGLDVTHQARVTVAESDAWATLGTRTGRVFADLFRFFARFHRERYGWDGSPIHDAVAVAHALGLGIVRTERYRVDIETQGRFTRGRTVVDEHGLSGRTPNADVGVGIDRERFLGLVRDALAAFP